MNLPNQKNQENMNVFGQQQQNDTLTHDSKEHQSSVKEDFEDTSSIHTDASLVDSSHEVATTKEMEEQGEKKRQYKKSITLTG